MRAVIVPALFLALTPAAHASTWTPTQAYGGAAESAAPRVAISAAGAGTVAWTRADGRLVVAQGTSRGRFGKPVVVGSRGVRDYAVAPGAIAYEAGDGVHAVVGGHDRLVARGTGSEINGVAIAADPLGGYV